LVFVLSQLSMVALAADLPSAATPGGALPILEDSVISEPFVYPNVTPAQPSTESTAEELIDTDAPRMLVKGFRIVGVNEYESLGIGLQSIEQMVQDEALKLMAGAAARGFTLAMFESITNAIASFYRSRGFFLARAYIPEQTVTDSIVDINIVEGVLDQVVFKGNTLYSDEQFNNLFKPLIGKAIFIEDIENSVFIINDFPGVNANVLFGPGLKPGTAAIQMNVQEEPSMGYLTWDNFGSNITGENRLRGNYRLNNVFGLADQIDLNLILTQSPANSTYFDVGYEQPLLDYRYLVGGGLNSNDFDVGGNLKDLGINGQSRIINGYMTRIIRRSRTERITANVDLSLKNAKSNVISTLASRDKLTVLSARADYGGTSWSSSGAYQQIGVKLSIGIADFLGSMGSDGDELSGRLGGSEDYAGGDFTKLNFDYLRVQKFRDFQSINFKFSAQTSSDLLTSLEQFSMGGPETVRAYPVAEALMDNAWLASIEWRVQASPEINQGGGLNGLVYSLFLDYAKGSLNDPLTNDIESVSLSGFGYGFEVRPYNKYSMRMQFAWDLGDTPSDNQTLPYYMNFRYDF
jgi:hemolysin activation/secretion protein